MGRKSKYETHVLPHLQQIQEWYQDLDEAQIIERLGVSSRAWQNYKNKYPELREALKNGRAQLVSDLKTALKKKAKGYTYEETKTIIREEGGSRTTIIEKYKKYAHPDTGAIHLLLKNYDEKWHNDDAETIRQKQEQLEIARQKAEADNW